jgi:hypothetical protein
VIGEPIRSSLFPAVSTLVIISACLGQPLKSNAQEPLKDRWFFSFGYGRNAADVKKIKSLIDIGAAHGLNGMVLSSFGLDSITRWKERDIALLKEVAAYCEEKQIELIPTGFSVGYGGGALGHDRNFAAALPTRISLTVKEGKIIPITTTNMLKNGDLEQHSNQRFAGFAFHDQPGEVSFPDTVAASGKSAIRFTHFGQFEHGHGRIMQTVAVRPGHSYRFSFKLKTQALEPISGLNAMVMANGRSLANVRPRLNTTQDWTEVILDYINKDETEIKIYTGIWQGTAGTFWIDDLRFYEYGSLSNIVRRPGTPLTIKSRDRNTVYGEGKDFQPIQCLNELSHVRLTPGSALREGEQLELFCYKIPFISHAWGKQISLCMSNPELYDYWQAQARKLHQIIPFKRILLSMDEIRNGGGCASCQERELSMAEILGDCITRQHSIFKAIDPDIEVIIWSDMLDPAHNARSNYYGVVGDFTGSWQYVPKDLTVMCWYHKIRDTSLGFFSQQGFPTFGAGYYDADDLTNIEEWIASLRQTPRAQGIMYTTWLKKYRLLGDYGDLVSEGHSQ